MDGRVVVGHEVVVEAVEAEAVEAREGGARLVGVEAAQQRGAVVVGEEDLVEARVALRFVAEVDELGDGEEVLVVRAAFQMQMA